MQNAESTAMQTDIAIVGGGASGVFAGIRASELAPGKRITILEASRQPLTKVKISGGGRCNVTHHLYDPRALVENYPRGHRELRGPLHRFQPENMVRWLEQRGVRLKTEADGRMFPTSDRSQTIIDCLLGALAEGGVDLVTRAPIHSVRPPASAPHPTETNANVPATKFVLTARDGRIWRADKLMLATGSGPVGHRLARSLGHTLTELAPSLFTFQIEDPRLDGLAGLSTADAILTLRVPGEARSFTARGPLLVTHWGLSGPAVLRISAFAARALQTSAYRAALSVDFRPDLNKQDLEDQLLTLRQTHPRKDVANTPLQGIPKRLWERLCANVTSQTGAARLAWSDLSKSAASELVKAIQAARFEVRGKGVFKDEFVTAGGVSAREIDWRRMESKLVPGLFFGGEILDVDGVTGGFNFQNAWTTSWIAGEALAQGDEA